MNLIAMQEHREGNDVRSDVPAKRPTTPSRLSPRPSTIRQQSPKTTVETS